MMTYLVIGLCLFLLVVVVYISAKPISMGIEARRNMKDDLQNHEEIIEDESKYYEYEKKNTTSISDEIAKLNDLKNKGVITEQEYEKAKDKLLN